MAISLGIYPTFSDKFIFFVKPQRLLRWCHHFWLASVLHRTRNPSDVHSIGHRSGDACPAGTFFWAKRTRLHHVLGIIFPWYTYIIYIYIYIHIIYIYIGMRSHTMQIKVCKFCAPEKKQNKNKLWLWFTTFIRYAPMGILPQVTTTNDHWQPLLW